jgi:hypothetical protein
MKKPWMKSKEGALEEEEMNKKTIFLIFVFWYS